MSVRARYRHALLILALISAATAALARPHELIEGRVLVEAALARVEPADAERLKRAVADFAAASDDEERAAVVLAPAVQRIMAAAPDRTRAVEYDRVLEEEVIVRNGKKYAWTIPLAFPVSEEKAKELQTGKRYPLIGENKLVVGTIEVRDVYPWDKKKYNASVYGTPREDHPGARIANSDPRTYLVGDRILAVNGTDVDTLGALRARLQDIYLRNPLKLRVDREGEPVVLTLPAAQMPSS